MADATDRFPSIEAWASKAHGLRANRNVRGLWSVGVSERANEVETFGVQGVCRTSNVLGLRNVFKTCTRDGRVARRFARFKSRLFVGIAMMNTHCVSTRVDKSAPSSDDNYPVAANDASTDAAVPTLSAGMTPLTPGLRTQLVDAACVEWVDATDPTPTTVELLVDTCSDMSAVTPSTGAISKWLVAQSSLLAVVDGLPQLTEVGMLLFPNQGVVSSQDAKAIDVSNCVNTSAMVAVAALGRTGSDQRHQIANHLNSAVQTGELPVEDALRQAVNRLSISSDAGQTGVAANIVLLLGGQPSLGAGCVPLAATSTDVDYSSIVDVVSRAWDEKHIQTYVIGAPGSERDATSGADIRGWLSRAATAGQTPITANCSDTGIPSFCHYDVSQAPDFRTGLQHVLQAIVGLILPCNYSIPQTPSGHVVDAKSLNVIFETSDPQQQMLIGQTDASCPSGGWYLDSSGSISLCAQTCSTVHQNLNAQLRIVAGCGTVAVIN